MQKNPPFEVKLRGACITGKVKAIKVYYINDYTNAIINDCNIFTSGRVELTFFDGSKEDHSLADCEIIILGT
ncbi:hypothetical protein EFU40_05860 [Vibrio cholerae]|nr:hypothetical protein [Vibrio cholerae]